MPRNAPRIAPAAFSGAGYTNQPYLHHCFTAVGILGPFIALFYIPLEWKSALTLWIVCILVTIWLAWKVRK